MSDNFFDDTEGNNMPAVINSFQGECRFLSNFWMCPVLFDGINYPSSEHAYQAAKTLSTRMRLHVAQLTSPGQAKRAGRSFNVRDDWEQIKFSAMMLIVLKKFLSNPELLSKLLATGNVTLIEGNTWGDTYWGVCDGKGYNHLGQILMLVRDHAKSGDDDE